MSPTGRILVWGLAALAAAGTAAFAIRGINMQTAELQHATVLPEPMQLPEFRLVDQDNRPFTRSSLLGRQTLLFFGFTHCPDICPATLQVLATARRQLAAELPGTAALPDILLISVDPQRDPPAALKSYTGYFGAGVKGVTGDHAELRKLTSVLGIYYSVNDSGSADYSVDHSTAVLLINSDAEFQAVFGTPLDVDTLVADLRILGKRR
jgi:protein SCO1/2